jgi:hypothetical protein
VFVTVCSHPIPAVRFVGIFVGIVLVSGEQTFTATFAIPNEEIDQMARKNDGACADPKQIRTDVDCRAARPKFDKGAWSPAKISDVTSDSTPPAGFSQQGFSQGRIVKNTGDGFLAEFPSAVEAVRAALQFQTRIKELTVMRKTGALLSVLASISAT